jgi:hypothetical protein
VFLSAQVCDIPERTEKPAAGQTPRRAFHRNNEDVGCSVGTAVSGEKASKSPSAVLSGQGPCLQRGPSSLQPGVG